MAPGYISEVCPGEGFYAFVRFPDTYLLDKRNVADVEVRIDDGRTISAEQRRKIYATLNDMSLFTGHLPEEQKAIMKYWFIAKTGGPYFSLSDADMTTANEFLTFLLEFCLEWDIPTQDNMLDRSPDAARYIYACLAHKKCIICNGKAYLHHADRVGMGRNRKEITHAGMRAQPLCAVHHREAHDTGQTVFDEKYHVFGVKLDRTLCGIWKVKS